MRTFDAKTSMKDLGNTKAECVKLLNRLDSPEFHLRARQERMGSLVEHVKRRKKALIKFLGELEDYIIKLNQEKQKGG